MKYLKIISLAVVVGLGSTFITGCGGEDAKPKPSIAFTSGGDYVSGDVSLAASRSFTVGVELTHSTTITNLEISVSINGGPSEAPANCDLCDSSINANNFTADFTAMTGSTAGTEVWSFTATDAAGQMNTKTLTITNLGPGGAQAIPFTQDNQQNPFRIHHPNFQGGNYTAYQFGRGNILPGEPNEWKDVADSTAPGELDNWPGRWISQNGTKFKNTTIHSWGSIAYDVELTAAWNDIAGSGDDMIVPQKGEFYLAKVGPSGKVVLIEITDRVETSNDDTDYIQFIYKFAP